MNNRRSFLKNTALSGLALSILKNNGSNKETKPLTECEETTQDYYGEGPFYTDNPPMIDGNKLASDNFTGKRMVISGRVLNLDCDEFIPDTVVDVWHADDSGAYDNQGFDLRGFTKTNDQGFYLFETIKPGKYLNGSAFRPSHIHYKITPPGFQTLTTQLYFKGDESIEGDAAASIKDGSFNATNRIIELTENDQGILEGTFDIIINGSGITVGSADLHLDKGMVYAATPNPFQDTIEIQYGVFKKSKVGLIVYNLSGQQVAILEDKTLAPEKYTSIWNPPADLAPGYYFIALRINDFQVHYLKVNKIS